MHIMCNTYFLISNMFKNMSKQNIFKFNEKENNIKGIYIFYIKSAYSHITFNVAK